MNELLELCERFKANTIAKADFIEAMYARHQRLFDYPPLLGRSTVERLLIDEAGVRAVTRAGLRFLLNPQDRRQPPFEAVNFGSFEGDDEAMLARLVAAGDRVFDVGANVGWHALHLAHANSTGMVYAFEPVPATYARLEANVALNDRSNIATFPFGLGEREETLTLYLDESMPVGASAVDHAAEGQAVPVECRMRSLDAVVAELGVQPDVVKIDVEGAELFVLRGAAGALDSAHPAVFCELLRKWAASFGYHPNEAIDLMVSLGYRCYETVGARLEPVAEITESTVATNFIFLHPERHAPLLREVGPPDGS